jgi:tetratricopeptide (TPR) repeat protein
VAIAIGLLKTLLELSRSRKSGVIDAAVAGARVRLFMEDGDIVFADEGTVGETLGRILVREKVLSEEQYGAAIEWMADLRARGKNAKLGEVFVELGMLTQQQVHAALSAQVRQKVVRALGWSTAKLSVMESYGPLEVAGRFPTQLEPLVIAALRLVPEDEVEELFDQAKARYIELVETNRIAAFELRAQEQSFALSLDGSRTAAELFGAPDAPASGILLAALLLFDCLALHATAKAPRRAPIPRPAPAIRRATASTPRMAAVPPALPRRAPPPLPARVPPAKPSSPDLVRPPRPSEKERIRTVAARLRSAQHAKRALARSANEALYELAIPTPQTPVAPVARLLAEKAFQAGRNLARTNEMAKALVELRRACVMFPAAEYELWACWVALRVEGPSDERIGEVRRTVERALAQDPCLGFAWFVLGHLALREGDAERADDLFARARELEPQTVDELRDVRLRDGRPSSSALDAKAEPPPPIIDTVEPETPAIPESEAAIATTDAAQSSSSTAREDDVPPTEPSADRLLAAQKKDNVPPPLPEARSLAGSTGPASSRPRSSALAAPRARTVLAAGAVASVIVGIAWARGVFEPPIFARPDLESSIRPDAALTDAALTAVAPTEIASSDDGRRAAIVDAAVSLDPDVSTNHTATTSTSAPEAFDANDLGAPLVSPADASSVAVLTRPAPSDAIELTDAGESSAARSDDRALAADGASIVIAPTMGALTFPPAANGHRVYFDGRMIGAPPGALVVPCGKHIVRVGSAGHDQDIDIPCGGTVAIRYP